MDSVRNEASRQIHFLKDEGWIIDASAEKKIKELYRQVTKGSLYFIGSYNSTETHDLTDEEIREEMESRLFMSISLYLDEHVEFKDGELREDIDCDRMLECLNEVLEDEFPKILANPFLVLRSQNKTRSIFNYYLLSQEKINSLIDKINKMYDSVAK